MARKMNRRTPAQAFVFVPTLVFGLLLTTGISVAIIASLLFAATPVDAAPGLQVADMVDVTGPVSLSASCSALQSADSPQVAEDPTDPNHILVSYTLGDGRAPVVADSTDGGASWSRVAVPGTTDCTGGEPGGVFDPFLAVGAGGRVAVSGGWVSNSSSPAVDHDYIRLFVGHSSDGGESFAPVVEPEPKGADQRAPLSFDPTVPDRLLVAFERVHFVNPEPGYLYGVGGSVAVSRSENAGATFDEPPVNALVTLPGREALTIGLLRLGTDVIVIAVTIDDASIPAYLLNSAPAPLNAFGQPVAEHLVAIRSTDGGQTFGSPVPIGDFQFSATLASCCIPDAAAGPDNTLYVTWVDAASRTIIVARSGDGGASWTTQQAVSTPSGATMPGIAVRPDGGVGLFYYVMSPDPGNAAHTDLTPYVAFSADGATGWTAAPIAGAFDVDAFTDGSTDGTAVGPYQDIAGVAGGFDVAVTLGGPPYAPAGHAHVWFVHLVAG